MERRIVVSGYYGSKNAGDEAMLAAMLEVLGDLDPKLHITVISASPADTSARHGVESVSWLSLPSIIKALWRADLLISGGGSLLQNVTSRRSLYYYLAIIFLAVIMRKKVMLYAQGIGPIIGTPMTPANINACRRMASMRSMLPTSERNSLVVYSSLSTVQGSCVRSAMDSAA